MCVSLYTHTHMFEYWYIVARFLIILYDKVSWRPNLIGHGVQMMQKQQDARLKQNKIHGCEQNRQVEVHITDIQSWNSCRKVASDCEFTFDSAIEPTKKKHNAL